jgi:RNA polymerase-binding transcription factor
VINMTKTEVTKFQKSLEASVVEFENSARRRDAILIETAADELDRIMGAAERELAVRNLDTLSVKRREARAALQRMREGTYGICVECEEPISAKRLAAVPWTPLCIHCQQALDCTCEGNSDRTYLKKAA